MNVKYVYDLEVEDTHCYFAANVLVSNCHEEKGADTAQGNALGALASACQKIIGMTGTMIGGLADHIRPLLFRLAPGSLIDEGLGWSDVTKFNEMYGRIETRITEKSGKSDDSDNRMSRGSSKTKTKHVRPGVMPALFGKHLIGNAVFLSLAEVASNLPAFTEQCIPVTMDTETASAYCKKVEEPLRKAIKSMIRKGDRRLLGTMLQTLLAYPDYPYGWESVGYYEQDRFIPVAYPPNLDPDVTRPKEQALIDLVLQEKAAGRKVWVYVQFTDKHAVQERLQKLLQANGVKVGVLKSTVAVAKREEWIGKNAPKLDVIISHPKLVETGLDFFDKKGSYNLSTVVFFQTGYNLFTLRQASRRAWRIGQREKCRVIYFYYEKTMQDRAMTLMGKKLTAAQALEGRFSSEGLAALAGEDASVEIALAKSLVERMDDGDARRTWTKIASDVK